MSSSNRRGGPWFHLQGAGLLGAITGAIVGSVFPPLVGGVTIGIGLIVFVIFFNTTLWPLISRKGLYENFFGIHRANPLIYLVEGAAGGMVVGGLVGIVVPGYLVLLLVLVGAIVLAVRYNQTLRLLASTLGAKVGGGTTRSAGYHQLLRRAGGDENLVERLISYEQKRDPAATREEWIQRAIMRWDRDKR